MLKVLDARSVCCDTHLAMTTCTTQPAPALPTVAQVRAYRSAMAVNDRVVGQAAREKSAASLKKLEAGLAARGLSVADMDRFDLDWCGNTQIVITLR